jgi:hypothetical protein
VPGDDPGLVAGLLASRRRAQAVELLRERGPLSASQIARSVDAPLKEIARILQAATSTVQRVGLKYAYRDIDAEQRKLDILARERRERWKRQAQNGGAWWQ